MAPATPAAAAGAATYGLDTNAVSVDLDRPPTPPTNNPTRHGSNRLNAQVVTPIVDSSSASKQAKSLDLKQKRKANGLPEAATADASPRSLCMGRAMSNVYLVAVLVAIGLAIGLTLSAKDTTRRSFSSSTTKFTPPTAPPPPVAPAATPAASPPPLPPRTVTIATMTTTAPLTSIVVSSTGTIYLAYANSVMSLTEQNPSGTLFAGALTPGLADGYRTNARFDGISGLAFTSVGDLIIADTANHRIRNLNMATGNVATIAGDGQSIATDGSATAASTGAPTDVAVDQNDNIFLYSSLNGRIQRLEKSTDTVTTLPLVVTSSSALQLVVSPFGQIFFGQDVQIDTLPFYTNTASSFMAGGAVSTAGFADGLGALARFAFISDMVYSRTGSEIYIADKANHCIRKLRISDQQVTTVAGLCGVGGGAFADGTLADARFTEPSAITVGPNGELYVVDGMISAHRVRKIIL